MNAPAFLIVRFSAIGDCVMAVPVASAIRRSRPDAFIAWAVEDRCSAVIDKDSLVDWRWEARRQAWKSRRWSPRTWAEQIRYYTGLRERRFDFGLDLQGHGKTALCLRIAAPARRVSVPATDALARRLNPQAQGLGEGLHTVERNLTVLRTLGEFGAEAGPIMPKLDLEREWVRSSSTSTKPMATLTVSAGSAAKVVPLDRLQAVGADLQRRGFEVAFLGGPGDPQPALAGAIDWVGKLPLEKTMAAVAESAVHVCGDTGTGHLAAAYGVPVVSVFGPMDPARYRPYTEKAVVLKEGGQAADVPLERILEAAHSVLERYVREIPH